MRKSSARTAVALTVALCACDATAPDTSNTLASVLQQVTNADAALLHTAQLSGTGSAIPMLAATPAGCTYQAESSFFVCPDVVGAGLTFSRKYQLLSTFFQTLDEFDAERVAMIRVVTDVQGTFPSEPVSVHMVTAHQDRVVSGLLTGTPKLSGTGSFTLVTTIQGSAPSSIVTTTSGQETLTNLALPPRPLANIVEIPASGTIVEQLRTSFGTGGLQIGVTVTATFVEGNMVIVRIESAFSSKTLTCTYSTYYTCQ